MQEVKLSKEARALITGKIQDYFLNEHDIELGNMDADAILRFFAGELGGLYYNCGLRDAETVFQSKLEDISDTLYGLQQQTALER